MRMVWEEKDPCANPPQPKDFPANCPFVTAGEANKLDYLRLKQSKHDVV